MPSFVTNRREPSKHGLLSPYADLSLAVPTTSLVALLTGLVIVLFTEPSPDVAAPVQDQTFEIVQLRHETAE